MANAKRPRVLDCAHGVIEQGGMAPHGSNRGAPGDPELREARGHAVETRIVVEAGADQVVEAVSANGGPVAMHFENECTRVVSTRTLYCAGECFRQKRSFGLRSAA